MGGTWTRGPRQEGAGGPDSWLSEKSGHRVSVAPTPLGLSRSIYYLLNYYFLCWGGEGGGRRRGFLYENARNLL